jgi:hypothetical protein
MKKIALMLAGLAGLAASPAHAALSVNLSLPSGTFGSPSVFCGAGDISTGPVSGGSCFFTETVTFDTPAPLNLVSASITTIAVGGVGSSSDINFTSVTLNGVNFALSSLIGGVFEVGGLSNLAFLAPGSHTLTVSGYTFGSGVGADGSYSGTLTFATAEAPVPEPATWLSMILGFGALGFAMRNQTATSRRVNFKMA